MNNIAASLNAEIGCRSAISGLRLVTTPLEVFRVPPEFIDNITVDIFDSNNLVESVDYTRADDQTFDITQVVRNWMSSSSGSVRPLDLIILGAENPPSAGLSSVPNVGKHRKRRHAVRWLRIEEHKLDNNEWEFCCYHNAGQLRIELEF